MMKKALITGLTSAAIITSVASFAVDKTLTVITTGDYAPLTVKTKTGYQGYSIDIINAFAKDNGYSVKFVPTTWGSMSSDLAHSHRKFEMAVGGISRNKQRSSDFLLSDAVTTSGKIALIRCADKSRFPHTKSALHKALNQPSVRIVENNGGTNAIYAAKHFPQANIIYVKNNSLPFTYLEQKKADVMITDLIEGRYKAEHGHYTKPLCVANPTSTFDHFDKVFMVRKNETKLMQQFNNWLSLPSTQAFLKKEQKEKLS